MVAGDDPLAVGENRVAVLHHDVGRQSAVLLRQVHRPARHGHPHAERARLFDLDVDGILAAGRDQVMMVGRRGAARHEQFGQRQAGAEADPLGREPGPHGVEGLQPGKQLLVDRSWVGPREGLEHVVMGVDEARQDHVLGRIEHGIGRRARLAPAPHQFGDPAVLDDDPALRPVGEAGERVLDPQTHFFESPIGTQT
jgi:hypothetical protein